MLPILVPNPVADDRFVALARRLLREGLTMVAFERELRRTYPRAVVHSRGLSGETIETWYVYRDGAWQAKQDGPGRRRRQAASISRSTAS